MVTVKNLGRFLTVGMVMFAVVMLTSDSTTARPKFAGVVKKAYPDLAKAQKINCYTCHPNKPDNKKKVHRNNYGVALKKALGKKNEGDADKITAALKKIESEKSATEGKTFGDLIKAGELPGTDEYAD